MESAKRSFVDWGGSLFALVCAIVVSTGTLIGLMWFIAHLVSSSAFLRSAPPGFPR